ncbi:MAG: DNA polymerase III subunit gamma/tau, partial [Oscillospiraceae bacterium]|nr:DNA polymerase III subunit gamma/tau [Oscillospiraceae bacterium]
TPPRRETAPAGQDPAGAGGPPPFWPALKEQAMGQIPMGEYTFLCDSASTDCRLQGDMLELWAVNDFIRGLLDKPSVTEPVSRLASALAGRTIRTAVKQGTPPNADVSAPQSGGADPFQDLLALGQQFDNITIV